MVLDDARQVTPREQPPTALWAIVAVAIAPFVGGAIVYLYGPPGMGVRAMTVVLTWSAAVLAFLGGVRWGLETARRKPRRGRLGASAVAPAAAAVFYMARDLVPDAWIVGGFLVAFLLQWLFDHRGADVPARYPRLSTALTAGACVSLAFVLETALKA
jgi:hypothetical protein